MVAEHVLLSPQERIPERICEHIRDVQLPLVRILDVPVTEMVKQLMKLPKTVSEDGIQQRTVERIADIPVPQVAEELVLRGVSQGQDPTAFCGADH